MEQITGFRGLRRSLLAGIAVAGSAAVMMPKAASAKSEPFKLSAATSDITPFKIDIPSAALDDLKQRLGAVRWPEKEAVTDWSQGVPLAKMQALANYWRSGYDLRRIEKRLNAFPQYRTHGWPGSVVEFLKVIEPLTDPTAHGGKAEDAFHVIVPSLPGFGFSDKPTEEGWNVVRIAQTWATLMQRLGYSKWVAQGGD